MKDSRWRHCAIRYNCVGIAKSDVSDLARAFEFEDGLLDHYVYKTGTLNPLHEFFGLCLESLCEQKLSLESNRRFKALCDIEIQSNTTSVVRSCP